MSTLYFVKLDDCQPIFKPLYVSIKKNPSREEIKIGVLKLLKKYFKVSYCWKCKEITDTYETVNCVKCNNDKDELEIYEDIDEYISDLYNIQHYVSNGIDEYYSIAFSIDKQPCIIWCKNSDKRFYRWN